MANYPLIESSYRVVGIMSGTSMDGIDIAYCFFHYDTKRWRYRILKTQFIPYDYTWPTIFRSLASESPKRYYEQHNRFGHYLGQVINQFIKDNHIENELDFIVSHGQTIFHDPIAGYTMQIGDGAAIAAKTGFPVISDLRSYDMALGGQGAPIVPIADYHLFSEYRYCLNLGGIANLSTYKNNRIIAYDIAGCNLVFNRLANYKNKDYDEDGIMARAGIINEEILARLREWEYLKLAYPKSLDASTTWPIVFDEEQYDQVSIEDKMCTYAEFLAKEISNNLCGDDIQNPNILITGGGALNEYLIERIEYYAMPIKVVIPSDELVNYKEALAMAFFGVLRMRGEANYLTDVTGAQRAAIGGALYQGWRKKL